MKTIPYFWYRGLSALVLGVLLVAWPQTAMLYLVLCIGALFLLPGVLSVLSWAFHRPAEGEQRGMFPVAGIGSALFGFWLMLMPDFFVNFLMYVLGFLLLMGGVHQLAMLLASRRYVRVHFAYYVVPVGLVAAGLVVLLRPFEVAASAFVVLGVCGMVYGLAEMLDGWLVYRAARRMREETEVVETVEAEEVEAEEVES
ncbi:MAG: HdeD family acid-resistance protein [Bacteroidaceae bacterium]